MYLSMFVLTFLCNSVLKTLTHSFQSMRGYLVTYSLLLIFWFCPQYLRNIFYLNIYIYSPQYVLQMAASVRCPCYYIFHHSLERVQFVIFFCLKFYVLWTQKRHVEHDDALIQGLVYYCRH